MDGVLIGKGFSLIKPVCKLYKVSDVCPVQVHHIVIK